MPVRQAKLTHYRKIGCPRAGDGFGFALYHLARSCDKLVAPMNCGAKQIVESDIPSRAVRLFARQTESSRGRSGLGERRFRSSMPR